MGVARPKVRSNVSFLCAKTHKETARNGAENQLLLHASPVEMSLHPRTSCLAVLIVALCLSSVARGKLDMVMDHEPVEHLKAHLPKTGDEKSGRLERFLRLPRQEMTLKTAQIEKNLRNVLKEETHVSAFLLKQTTVLAERAAAGIQFNSTFLLPYGILLPILSTALPILLEGYKSELIRNTMGSVLKKPHRNHKDVKNYLTLNLHDLVTKVPHESGLDDLDNPALLSDLNERGKAALYYVNTVLESVAEDAWRDALISVAMDDSAFSDSGQMLSHFKDLGMYTDTLANDLINFYEVSKSDAYPLDAGHYMFGWWFNCPRSSKKTSACLAPFLPSDCVAILNPAIRIYSIPRLRLHLIVGNTGSTGTHTLKEVLHQDKLIWNALYSAVDPASAKDVEEAQQATPSNDKRDTKESESPTPKDKVAHHTSDGKSVQEDEVIGESTPKSKSKNGQTSGPKSSSATTTKEEDIVVEEMTEGEMDGEKSLLVRAIHMSWPVTVFLFYTVFSHVWVYWIIHLLWLVCSSLFSGIYLPRPKTAKQD